MSALAAALWAAMRSAVGFRELLLFGSALLIGIGLSITWLPAAFIVPGAMLGYVAIFGVK